MSSIFPTYARFDVKLKEATGMMITDTSDKTYLDFTSGIGVCNLGHRHPNVQKHIEDQLNKYWHVSNLYHNPIQERVAKALTEKSSGDLVFFSNSGAEANEAAIKLARKVTGKETIITFNQSFHGRTFATMAATGQEKVRDGFGPMLKTFAYGTYNDSESVKQLIDSNTAAIMFEVVQGEGGVLPASQSFIDEIVELAKQHDLLIIIDEIQTGIGRTGKAFGYEHYGLDPDIITVAKGLGNGMPVGAMIAKEKYKGSFGPGSHGSTFGGNPLAMSAAEAVIKNVFNESFLKEVENKGNYLINKLKKELEHIDMVKDIRGKGLMVGIECSKEVTPSVQGLIDKGVLTLSAGPYVLRLLPPLIVTYDEIDKVVELIKNQLSE
ncbi:MAG TPA: acetylornithine transaminase [Pseudogracilibacillus sp.]|nr:acetylornithine transaminase [Pseudogracilibacillus sp.]